MNEHPFSFLSVLAVFALVGLNAFFVAVEFALVRTHPTKIRSAEMKGKFGVASSLQLMERLDQSLSATQLGITIASLLLGWWGEETFQRLFVGLFGFLGESAAFYVSHGTATVCALVVITFLHVVLGELAAKSLAISFPETVLRFLAPPMRAFAVVCGPFTFFFNGSANVFLRMIGVKRPPESERAHSIAELAMLVSQSSERGVLDKSEEEMLHGVFNFAETVAREVMTPRPDLVTLPADATLDEIIDVFTESGLSRLPVTGEGVDDIVGILLIRDLLPFLHNHQRTGPLRDFSIARVMREPYFVPGTKRIDDLLNEFKRRKIHLAIVLDEHGGVDGLVTLEDLLEEIVGDIFDESDVAERDMNITEDGDALVDGGVLVADINARLELDIPEGDYDTIAGFVLTSLGRLPKAGDKILVDQRGNVHLNGHLPSGGGEGNGAHREVAEEPEEMSGPQLAVIVERVKGRRIEVVRLHRIPGEEFAESAGTSAASEGRAFSSGEK